MYAHVKPLSTLVASGKVSLSVSCILLLFPPISSVTHYIIRLAFSLDWDLVQFLLFSEIHVQQSC